MTSLARSDLPLTDGLVPLHWALASDIRKSAAMVFPAAVRLTSATDASDRLAFPRPIVVACATAAPFNPPAAPSEIGGTSRREASCAPPLEGRGPVLATVIGDSGGMVTCTTYACPLKVGVEDVCAMVPAGIANSDIRAARMKQREEWHVFSCAIDATIPFSCQLPERSGGRSQHGSLRRKRHSERLTREGRHPKSQAT